MCWQCDHPNGNYLDHLLGLIRDHGWAVQGVEGDRIHAPWAYTVGLTAYDRPELVVTGLPLPAATQLLNDMAAHALHADAPVAGEQIPLRGGPLVEVVGLTMPSAHLNMAVELYGPDIRALQLVHTDDRGRWPWQRGFRGRQPVLGARS